MKKILINRKPFYGPWGGGIKFLNSLYEYAAEFGWEVVNKFEPNLDAIFIMDPEYDELGISVKEVVEYKEQFPNTKVIHRVHHSDLQKGRAKGGILDHMFRISAEFSDATVWISNWSKEYHSSGRWGWADNKQEIVYNGVDLEMYKPGGEKIDNGKINILTHHWSDNDLKNNGLYEFIDDWVGTEEGKNFTFTYLGRTKSTFNNTKVIEPISGDELAKEVGRYDVYVTGTKYEALGNHVMECLATGMPIIGFEQGGGAAELIENAQTGHLIKGVGEVIDVLKSYSDMDKSKVYNTWDMDWKQCARKVYDIIESVL